MAAFAGQFVPIKLTTSANNADWKTWSRKHPSNLRGIPQIYVVRSDGKQLFAGVGSLPGSQLPTMLTAALNQSGRQFNDMEASLLTKQISASEKALEENDVIGAARALAQLTQLGKLGQLNSYATQAVRADELANELADKAVSAVDAILAKAKEDSEPFDAVLELVQYQSVFSVFPKANEATKAKVVELKKDSKLTTLIKPAEFIVKAREAAASPKASVKRRAETTYASVVRKYPDSRPGEIAAAELKKLKPNSKVLSSSPKTESHTSSELRTWKSADGKFTVSAAVVSEQNGKVTLKKADGKTIDVTEEQLSEGDRRYLSVWRELFSQ